MKSLLKIITEKHFKKVGYKGKYIDIRIKELRRGLVWGLLILSIVCFFFASVTYLPYGDKVLDKLGNIYLGHVSSLYEEDDISISLSTLCNKFEEEEEQIQCVNTFINHIFDYDTHDNETKPIRTPKEILNKGGCCRDYSTLYNSVFSLMGYKTEFVFEPEHVYLRVYGKENNYSVDQAYAWIENGDA